MLTSAAAAAAAALVATTFIVATPSYAYGFSLPLDEAERQLDALKQQLGAAGSDSSDSSDSTGGYARSIARFGAAETINGNLTKAIQATFEHNSTANSNNSRVTAPAVATGAAASQENRNNSHSHLRLHVDLPAVNVHDTYDNLDGAVTVTRGVPEKKTSRSAPGLQQTLQQQFQLDLERQVERELARKELQRELQREWTQQQEWELLDQQEQQQEEGEDQEEQGLLRVLYVTARVLLQGMGREQQDAALQTVGLQLQRLLLQDALQLHTLNRAAEMIVSALVEDLSESEAGLPLSYLALIGSRAMTSLTGKI